MARLIFVLSFLSCFSIINANSSLNEKKVCYTIRLESEVPVIDGKTDDHAWQRLEWEKGFVQHQAYEGKNPSQ